MATPQQKFYHNNREKVLAYKKEHYAKKSNKKVFEFFTNVKFINMTKRDTKNKIKTHIGNIRIHYHPPDTYEYEQFFNKNPQFYWTIDEWLQEDFPIRKNASCIEVRAEHYSNNPTLTIYLQPWMLERVRQAL